MVPTTRPPGWRRDLHARIAHHLGVLVADIGARPPGSPANHRATAHVAATLVGAGCAVAAQPFRTRWWEPGPSSLTAGGRTEPVVPDPFSPPVSVRGPVRRCDSVPELEAAVARPGALRGSILVLGGALGAEPVTPRAFPFLPTEEPRRRMDRIAVARPAAVVALSDLGATFPTFCDPDFGVPSMTVPTAWSDVLGPGTEAAVEIAGATRPGSGLNIAGRPAGSTGRVVVCAHVDSVVTTPGAVDNAGGVAALLAWAELGLPVHVPAELVFFNGEDHFDAGGEQAWLAATDIDRVALAVNLDGAGARDRDVGVVALAAPPPLAAGLAHAIEVTPGIVPAEPWYESDHAVFSARGIPAIAVSSAGIHDVLRRIGHTPADTLDQIDVGRLVETVAFLDRWLPALATSALAVAAH